MYPTVCGQRIANVMNILFQIPNKAKAENSLPWKNTYKLTGIKTWNAPEKRTKENEIKISLSL
jgi:hypothetical protein